ncbi:MAG TPA: hypothetical protein IGS17_21855 [Oscillatoriales cyanobacterium M59_W2019_021]|nr:hypothetical protein [Oscillatoriales cyanobacterium M4454_W2019_049]HIK53535.1 hypothetical protein [Oscillatoriales cyanobacterium M59_W2019_021]
MPHADRPAELSNRSVTQAILQEMSQIVVSRPEAIAVQPFASSVPDVPPHPKSVVMNEDSRFISQPELPDEDLLDEYDFSQAVRGNPRQYLRARSTVRIETENGDIEARIMTVEVKAIVDDNGNVTIQLPYEISPGEYSMTLLIQV